MLKIQEGFLTNIKKNLINGDVYSYSCQVKLFDGVIYDNVLLINLYNTNSLPPLQTKLMLISCGSLQKYALPLNTSYKPAKIKENELAIGNVEFSNYTHYTNDKIQIGADATNTLRLLAGGVKILSNISSQLERISEALDAIASPTAIPPASTSPQPLTTASQIQSAKSEIDSLLDELNQVI